MVRNYFVYILANKPHGTLYVGVTNNMGIRTMQHKYGLVDGFTKKYGVHLLVYYEIYGDIKHAIAREKQLKWWKRAWKISLIQKGNPEWEDLYKRIF